MVEVKVCVGSSCHMKGSYQVIQTYQRLIRQLELENSVTLKASFCMGCCMDGIATTVNGEPVNSVGFSNAEKVFYEKIYPLALAERDGGRTE